MTPTRKPSCRMYHDATTDQASGGAYHVSDDSWKSPCASTHALCAVDTTFSSYPSLMPFRQSELLSDKSTPGLKIADALEALAAADFSLTVGADETIQLLNVVRQVYKAYVSV